MNGVTETGQEEAAAPTARQRKAADIRARILASATRRIADDGLDGLRARDVAGDAGIALGSIYKHFVDFDDLVLHVNSATLLAMSEALEEGARDASDPAERLERLAGAYLAFAEGHPRLWAALFEHRMARGAPVPDWHLADHEPLFRLIAGPVALLAPELDEAARAVRTRTVFAAVHGVVALALQDRFIGVPRGALEDEVTTVARGLVAGLKEAG